MVGDRGGSGAGEPIGQVGEHGLRRIEAWLPSVLVRGGLMDSPHWRSVPKRYDFVGVRTVGRRSTKPGRRQHARDVRARCSPGECPARVLLATCSKERRVTQRLRRGTELCFECSRTAAHCRATASLAIERDRAMMHAQRHVYPRALVQRDEARRPGRRWQPSVGRGPASCGSSTRNLLDRRPPSIHSAGNQLNAPPKATLRVTRLTFLEAQCASWTPIGPSRS